MSEVGDRYASVAEATLALTAFTEADFARLGRVAQLRAHGIPHVSWEDLLNDAVERVLNGARRWPKDVPLPVFLREVIRSLASEARRRHVQAATDVGIGFAREDEADPVALLSDPAPDPERQVIACDLLGQIMALFEGDPTVTNILRAMAAGHAAEDIQRDLDLSPREYDTARRRLRRGLARHFPEGLA